MLHDTFVQSAPTVMVIHAYSNISQPSLGRSNHYLICLNFVMQPTPTDHHHGSPVYSKALRTHMHTISCYTFSQLQTHQQLWNCYELLTLKRSRCFPTRCRESQASSIHQFGSKSKILVYVVWRAVRPPTIHLDGEPDIIPIG